ncbi:Aste57867_21345 [Aphanomyces stellatus]|uniref:Aste57867_21345 protein n=1 Tax=Aphanomyces stellatus TaxID=120398 RepID=A0A485LIK0_9STRA|nr:hypothetical protein As57867_021276 [Aphanomyces stellatus]VFT98017.1 Aste57867_21345 [Aphanomyces stellatus]
MQVLAFLAVALAAVAADNEVANVTKVNVTKVNATNATVLNATSTIVLPATNFSSVNASRNATRNGTSVKEGTINFEDADAQSSFFNINNKDAMIVGAGFAGCIFAIAAVAVAKKNIGAAAATDASVLAEDVVDEIEAAENAAKDDEAEDDAAAPVSPAEKDEDVQEVSTDSPSVVSV